MIARTCATALAALLVSATAPAADLTKVERTIAKEPAYQTKSPRYCLLAFGPEAKGRAWLVWDGDTLYVDRNGNGDLTEEGEKVVLKRKDPAGLDGNLNFDGGSITDGSLRHVGLGVTLMKLADMPAEIRSSADAKAILARDPKARAYILMLEVEMPGRKGGGIGGRVIHLSSVSDDRGVFQFAERSQDAPILHLGGPWQVALAGKTPLRPGRDVDVTLSVGTRGLGPGTFAAVGYDELIPKDANPKVEIAFPPKDPGGAPVKELFELKQRC